MEEQKTAIEVIDGGIIIKPIGVSDVEAFYELLEKNKEKFTAYNTTFLNAIRNLNTKHTHIGNKLANHIKNKQFYFAIVTTYGKLIGCMCIYKIDWRLPKADLFYFIESGYPGVGILTHSFNWFISYCFSQLDMDKLGLNINMADLNLYKVAMKNGFKKEIISTDQCLSSELDVSSVNYYGLWRIQYI